MDMMFTVKCVMIATTTNICIDHIEKWVEPKNVLNVWIIGIFFILYTFLIKPNIVYKA